MSGNFDDSLIQIPIDEIRVGKTMKNIRTRFDEEKVRHLAASIRKDGLQNPITVMSVEDPDDPNSSFTELVSGERRLRAVRLIISEDPTWNDGNIEARLYVGTHEDAHFVNAKENIDREEVDELDISAWLHEEHHERGVNQNKLAEELHRQPSWVNVRISFHEKACDELKQFVLDGGISFSAAVELSRKFDTAEQKKRVEKARKFGEKITLEQAQAEGTKGERVARPGKKEREKLLAEVAKLSELTSHPGLEGMLFMLKWVEGLQTRAELDEIINSYKTPDGEVG